MNTTPIVMSVEEVAALMRCAVTTVESHARSGTIPALLWGDGGWVFPVEALSRRLNELAVEASLKRREPPTPLAVFVGTEKRRRKEPPKLPDLSGL
jgi:hypothetical protein